MENESNVKSNEPTEKTRPRFSDIITEEIFESHLKENNALCYISGTGSGKSYWVKNFLMNKGKILFVTSRRAKVNEDYNEDLFCSNLNKFKETDKSFLVTNSHLSKFIKSKPLNQIKKQVDEFLNAIKYVVIDEIHSIVCDSTFSEDVFTVQKFIEYAAFEKRMPVILLTATDQLIEEYIRNPINKKDCFWTSHNLIRESKNIIPTHIFKIKADFVTDILIPSLVNNGQKFIYFLKTEKDANSIVNMCCEKTDDKKGSIFINPNIEQSNILYFDAKTRKKTEDLRKSILKKLKDEGKPQVLVFQYDKNGKLMLNGFSNEKHQKKSNELAIMYLSEKSTLPDNTKILLATSALKEGISINNEDIHSIICYSHSLSELLQYMGRVRKSNYSLYIIEDALQFPSGINEIAYKFSEGEGVDAANKFILTLNDKDKNDFINYIEEKIPYIRYNYISNLFELYTVLYKYQKYLDILELKESKKDKYPKWEKEMYNFFNKYGFEIQTYKIDNTKSKYSNSYVKTAIKNILNDYGNKWLSSEEWKQVKKKLVTLFDLSCINKDNLNKELAEKTKGSGIMLNIKSDKKRLKDSDGKKKGNPVWQYYLEGLIEE